MASLNTHASATRTEKTHEGGKAAPFSKLQALRRQVLTCLLWEDAFYEKGTGPAGRIALLVKECDPEDVAALAVEARTSMQLRHVPLYLARELARVPGNGPLVERTLRMVIQRPDEMTEYVSMYWKDGRKPLSAASKRALRATFNEFTEYQLAKYKDADKVVKLKDVLRLVHPKPKDTAQAETYRKLRKDELVSTDTWEAELSAGKGKRETFERLITEKKLGALATLRNLRNMQTAGVSDALIRERLAGPMPRVWPYRYVVAAKYAPSLEDALEQAMFRSVEAMPMLRGRTGLVIDVSGSMDQTLGAGATGRATGLETSRIDVASGLAILLRERAESVTVATFSDNAVVLAPRRGFALRDAIWTSQKHNGTYLRGACEALKTHPLWQDLDRVIIITDEQSNDGMAQAWSRHPYLINVAAYKNGVGADSGWTHIEGWSERVFDYLQAAEAEGHAE